MLCGPSGGYRTPFISHQAIQDHRAVFETTDLNIAFQYRAIMVQENPLTGENYIVIVVE